MLSADVAITIACFWSSGGVRNTVGSWQTLWSRFRGGNFSPELETGTVPFSSPPSPPPSPRPSHSAPPPPLSLDGPASLDLLLWYFSLLIVKNWISAQRTPSNVNFSVTVCLMPNSNDSSSVFMLSSNATSISSSCVFMVNSLVLRLFFLIVWFYKLTSSSSSFWYFVVINPRMSTLQLLSFYRSGDERPFQYIGPVTWNSLPFSFRHATSLSSFKSKLREPTSSPLPTD